MHRSLRRCIRLAILLMVVAASHPLAQDWSDFATVSMTNATTPKLAANRLCYTDGRDMLCDAAAGLLTTSGTLSINTISATNIYGNTASLTALYVAGVAVTGAGSSGDRVVSGTTSMVANSSTSIISITTAGVTTGYFNSNGVLTLPGISATSNLTSVTSLYASGHVGIGTTNPLSQLHVASTVNPSIREDALTPGRQTQWLNFDNGTLVWYHGINYNNAGDGNFYLVRHSGSGSILLAPAGGGNVGIGTDAPSFPLHVTANNANGVAYLQNERPNNSVSQVFGLYKRRTDAPGAAGIGASMAFYADNSSNYPALAASIEGILTDTTSGSEVGAIRFYLPSGEGMRLTSNGLGIGTQIPNAQLEVSGTISATNFVGDGSGLTGIASTGDRIVSGSTNVIASNSGNVRVSGSLQFSGAATDSCSSTADFGKNRRNPASGRMQVCLFR